MDSQRDHLVDSAEPTSVSYDGESTSQGTGDLQHSVAPLTQLSKKQYRLSVWTDRPPHVVEAR